VTILNKSGSILVILRISTTGLSSQNIQQSADALATIMSKSTIPQIVQASGMLQLQAVGIKENPSMMKMDDTMAALRQINAKAIYIVADRDAAGNMTDALTNELPLAAKGVISGTIVATDAAGRARSAARARQQHKAYGTSQRRRKIVEEVFGWGKTISTMRRSKHIERFKIRQQAQLTAATYNLVRMCRLLAA